MAATAYPLKVLTVLRSPQGWAVVPVHYSHDKAKGMEWFLKERAKYATQAAWDQEMEIDFSSITGARAFPNFIQQLHVTEKVQLDPTRPLYLCTDFNISPCVWVVAQRQVWDGREVFVALDELVMDPGPIPAMAGEFDSRWRGTVPLLHIYGDAAGRQRTVQTSFTDYDLLLQYLRHWPRIEMFVPMSNPAIRDRLNSMNAALLDSRGLSHTFIHPRCEYLIEDFQGVVLDPVSRTPKKSSKDGDPYKARTHAADAYTYMVWWERPVPMGQTSEETSTGAGEVLDFEHARKAPKPHVLGALP